MNHQSYWENIEVLRVVESHRGVVVHFLYNGSAYRYICLEREENEEILTEHILEKRGDGKLCELSFFLKGKNDEYNLNELLIASIFEKANLVY